jgi:hypothetical protein
MRIALVWPLLLTACATAASPPQTVRTAPAANPHDAAAATQIWRGTLRCGPVLGLSRIPLTRPIQVTVTGNVAHYDHAIRIADTTIDTDVHERGDGAVAADGSLTLTGEASAPAYHYSAQYSGMLRPDGETSRLSGMQKWTSRRVRPYDRTCSMTLRRDG